MSLNAPTIAECEASLTLFWSKLTLEQKKNLGKAISSLVDMKQTNLTIMEIVQDQMANLGIWASPEFSSARERYGALSEWDQAIVRQELANYFLQRNPKT